MNMTQAELDEVLRQHAEWMEDDSTGKRLDLSGVDLRGASMIKASLSCANLRGADLRDAYLSGALLRHADLHDADLYGADLRDAAMLDVGLSGADLREADLRGADLRSARLAGANLSCADLRGANISNADIDGASLNNAKGVIDAGIDPRGFRFVGIWHANGLQIKAGCRWFSLLKAKAHWRAKENTDALARVTLIEALLTET